MSGVGIQLRAYELRERSCLPGPFSDLKGNASVRLSLTHACLRRGVSMERVLEHTQVVGMGSCPLSVYMIISALGEAQELAPDRRDAGA